MRIFGIFDGYFGQEYETDAIDFKLRRVYEGMVHCMDSGETALHCLRDRLESSCAEQPCVSGQALGTSRRLCARPELGSTPLSSSPLCAPSPPPPPTLPATAAGSEQIARRIMAGGLMYISEATSKCESCSCPFTEPGALSATPAVRRAATHCEG